MNRRELIKYGVFSGAVIGIGTSGITLIGCGHKISPNPIPIVDQVINALGIADQVAKNIANILTPVNPEMDTLVSTIDKDIQLIIKTYKDYDVAVVPDTKQAALNLMKATVDAISINLSALLDAVHVKNPTLITIVSVAVAIINTSITVVLSNLPASTTVSLSAHSASVKRSQLPLMQNASASDMKQAWNSNINKQYPDLVIK